METHNKITFSLTQKIAQNEPLVEKVFLIKKEKYFPEVGKHCRLHQKKERIIKVADINHPKQILYYYGTYKYWDDQAKKMRYITEKLPGVTGKRRHNNDTILKACEPVLRNEITHSYAAKQGRDLLNLTTVPSTIWKWIGILDIESEAYNEMDKKVRTEFSGHVSVDEVYDNGEGIVVITDPVKDTILSAELIEEPVTNEVIEREFDRLKKK